MLPWHTIAGFFFNFIGMPSHKPVVSGEMGEEEGGGCS